MKNLLQLSVLILIYISQVLSVQQKNNTAPFHKVIISPHIETTFVQGDVESVSILESTVDDDKINIEVNNGVLRVYLDDAKEYTKNKEIIKNGVKMKTPIYKGKVLSILVTYTAIDELSIRGEEKTLCKSPMEVENFKLKMYGESVVQFNEVNFSELKVHSYGESELEIKKGNIINQHITAYGEAIFKLVEVENETTYLTAYGEAKFWINASERIKFSNFGDAELHYTGTAEIDKGLNFGDSTIKRIKY